jgi:tetratricopeptide (TPR) repeat protein
MSPRCAAGLLALAFAAGCAAPGGGEPDLDAGYRGLRALAERARPDADPGTVDVLLAPDLDFLRARGADAVPSLERAVATVDRVLGPECGLRFRVGGAVLFPSTPRADDDRRILWEARLRLDRGPCDVVAAFTGQRCGDRAGAAEPRFRLLLCADAADPDRNLLHEAAHLFGAMDYPRGHPGYGLDSVMSYDSDRPRTLAFDALNLERIRARRGALPPARPDPVARAMAERTSSMRGPLAAALLGGFLCAESRTSQAEGIDPAERLLAADPGNGAAAWIAGECLRVGKERDAAEELLGRALGAVAAGDAPDGLDRHAALEIARLAVDGVDGMETLRPGAEAALARLARTFPADPEVLDLHASLRARAGDAKEAARLYREAAAADPAAVYPWRHLAELARTAGDATLWLEARDGALAADPLDPVLAVRFVEEGLEVYPEVIHSAARRPASLAALAAAEKAFPAWELPRRLLARFHRR